VLVALLLLLLLLVSVLVVVPPAVPLELFGLPVLFCVLQPMAKHNPPTRSVQEQDEVMGRW